MILIDLFFAGLKAVVEYASAHVLTCLVPAFFIAGAMSALIPKEKIIKYLGRDVPKYKAYPLAVIAGLLLAVCSCTVLPLFAGIKKNGAGIGPALAFLYTAPATNLLAIIFTGSVLGWNFALSRIILSVIFAILIGVIIAHVFRKDDAIEEKNILQSLISEKVKHKKVSFFEKYRLWSFFAVLIGILVVGTRVPGIARYVWIGILIIVLAIISKLFFTKDELRNWLFETWAFSKKIFPLLLAGIFVAGILSAVIPENFLTTFMGENTILANLIAVIFGVFMYFPTLVEVPMANLFLGLGMAKGPLLAYLLADPVISLASILVIRKLIGNKRTLVYVGLIIVFATISGLIYGQFVK
jgi:hypothetical protein